MIKTLLETLFGLFLVLQIADVATTMSILRHGGHELNPLLARAMSGIGALPALILLKAVAVAIMGAVIWLLCASSDDITYGVIAMALLDAWYLFIVARNVVQMHR